MSAQSIWVIYYQTHLHHLNKGALCEVKIDIGQFDAEVALLS